MTTRTRIEITIFRNRIQIDSDKRAWAQPRVNDIPTEVDHRANDASNNETIERVSAEIVKTIVSRIRRGAGHQ
jgi:hypothetical protein